MPYTVRNGPLSSSSLDSTKETEVMLKNITRSVSGLIRNNIYRALREMPDTDDFIVMEDIDRIMDSCLGGRSTFSGQVPEPVEPQPQPQPQPKMQPQPQPKPQSQPQQHPQPHQHPQPQQHPQAQKHPQPQQHPQPQPQPRPSFIPRPTAKTMQTTTLKSSRRQSYRDIMQPPWDGMQSSLDHLLTDSLPTESSTIDSSQAEMYDRFHLPTLGKFPMPEMQPTTSRNIGRFHQSPSPPMMFTTTSEVDTLLSELERNKLLVENFSILEARLNQLECRISEMLQAVPNIREYQRKKFKINTQLIREELKQLIHNAECYKEPTPPAEPKPTQQGPTRTAEEAPTTSNAPAEEPDESSTLTGGNQEENSGSESGATGSASEITLIENQESRSILSGFEEQSVDEYFYERRQNMINRLYFKKSVGTIALHQRRQQNLPYIAMQMKAPVTKRTVKDQRYPYFLEMSEKAKRVDMDDGERK